MGLSPKSIREKRGAAGPDHQDARGAEGLGKNGETCHKSRQKRRAAQETILQKAGMGELNRKVNWTLKKYKKKKTNGFPRRENGSVPGGGKVDDSDGGKMSLP